MTDQEALVVLNAVPGLAGSKVKQLAKYFGGYSPICTAKLPDLIGSAYVAPEIAQNICDFSKDKFLLNEYNLGQTKGVRVITCIDEDFPPLLNEIPGAPLVLYIKGNAGVLKSYAVAMVGSRVCSNYGKSMARQFARDFAEAGLSIVSGMARGIDTASHKGCLEAQGITVAVIACGFNYVYPSENRSLMDEISSRGAVISEMPFETPPLPILFPRRNRIITGLSLATVVVEAGEKSGALISVNYALEQGRDVFAIPANIDYTCAKGSNLLIKDGAKVALSPMDVLLELKGQIEINFPTSARTEKIYLNEEQMKVFDMLSSHPVHLEQIALQLNQPVGGVSALLLDMEIKGAVKHLPGQYFVKG